MRDSNEPDAGTIASLTAALLSDSSTQQARNKMERGIAEMTIADFTAEEIKFIAVYKADTKAATLQNMANALRYMDDDMRNITEGAARKLVALTGPEFSAMPFTPADGEA